MALRKMGKNLSDFLGTENVQTLTGCLNNSIETTHISPGLKKKLAELKDPKLLIALVIYLENRLAQTPIVEGILAQEPARELRNGIERLLSEIDAGYPGWIIRLAKHIRRAGYYPHFEQIIHRLGYNGFQPRRTT